MTIFEKLSTLAEITDQDEMIKACMQNHSRRGTSSGSGGSCSDL